MSYDFSRVENFHQPPNDDYSQSMGQGQATLTMPSPMPNLHKIAESQKLRIEDIKEEEDVNPSDSLHIVESHRKHPEAIKIDEFDYSREEEIKVEQDSLDHELEVFKSPHNQGPDEDVSPLVILNGSKKNNLVLEAMLSPPR